MSTESPKLRFDVSWYSSRRLLAFIAVSVALHALVLYVVPGFGGATRAHAGPGPLAVYLAVPDDVAKKTSMDNRARGVPRPDLKPAPAVHATAPPRAARSQPAQMRTTRTSRPEPAHRTPHPAPGAAQHPPAGPSPSAVSYKSPADDSAFSDSADAAAGAPARPAADAPAVAALLRQALQQHFRYPPLALQNSWEGRVVLHVRVAANGQVGEAHILKGSGFRVLDRAARRSANAIGQLPAARPLLAGRALSFRVPVDYRLRP